MLKKSFSRLQRKCESMKETIETLKEARGKKNMKKVDELIYALEEQVDQTIDHAREIETCIDCPELLEEQPTIDERKPVGKIMNMRSHRKQKSRPYNEEEVVVAALNVPKIIPTFFNKFSEGKLEYNIHNGNGYSTKREEKLRRSKSK